LLVETFRRPLLLEKLLVDPFEEPLEEPLEESLEEIEFLKELLES
ncbi:9202_t:CDS:1, partial [Dentiscutata erythropus]